MCRFRSGILLKTGCVVSEGYSDSHDELLKKLNIADTGENAMTKFVRVELIPPKNEWWTDPETWQINVDQDITPDWFETDREKYFSKFREAVKEWWNNHVIIDGKTDELSGGYYMLKRSEVKKLTHYACVMLDSAMIGRMYGSATVGEMLGSATVREMLGSATVRGMYDSATVRGMHGSAIARDYKNYPTIKVIVSGDENFKMTVHKNQESDEKKESD